MRRLSVFRYRRPSPVAGGEFWRRTPRTSLAAKPHGFSPRRPIAPAARTDRSAVTGHKAAYAGVGGPPASLVAALVCSGSMPRAVGASICLFRFLGAQRPIEIQNERRSRISFPVGTGNRIRSAPACSARWGRGACRV